VPKSTSSGQTLCAGPGASPGVLDDTVVKNFLDCVDEPFPPSQACSLARKRFKDATGCTGRCQTETSDLSTRGQKCQAQTAATCESTAVPCGASTAGPGAGAMHRDAIFLISRCHSVSIMSIVEYAYSTKRGSYSPMSHHSVCHA
jgi:hypothetical protein